MTRYYRIEGNHFTLACSLGILLSVLSLIMINDLYIFSIIGNIGFFMLLAGIMTIPLLLLIFFNPIYMSKRWYLSITKDGILDSAFGYNQFYPWASIHGHELKSVQHYMPNRYFQTLILRLDSKTISIPLHKYGIDTESEASSFLSTFETYLPST